MKRKAAKKKPTGSAGILIKPEPTVLDALNELADMDGRPLKVYVERTLAAHVKEINNPQS